jgi:predicted dehydrogenase
LNNETAQGEIRVGVAGLGYWGSNIARDLEALPGCELAWCCDPDPERRERQRRILPRPDFTADFGDLLADESLAAIAIATPVPTHAALAKLALDAGKHCFVEKPLAHDTAEAERVAALASERDLVLMVGHLLVYHPAVEALADLVEAGELGEIRYLYSQRLNLGRLRADENALWSLGAHDVSAILALAGGMPRQVSARGESYLQEGVEDVVFAHLAFADGVAAHIHVSWLDPRKERRLTVVGSQRMATFDDMAPERKLVVYDKGFDPDAAGNEFVARDGAEHCPELAAREPLRTELAHFLGCLRGDSEPRSGAAEGVLVVRVLDALQSSLDAGGESVAPAPEGAPR